MNVMQKLLTGILLGTFALPRTLPGAAVQETAFLGDRTLLAEFRYVRQATREAYGSGETPAYYAVTPDGAFFEAVRTPSELLLQRPDGKAEPFLFRKLTHTAVRPRSELLPGRISLVQALPDGRRAVDFELAGDADEIAGVELEIAESQSECTLEILVGDGRQWESALPETALAKVSPEEFGSVRNFPFARPRRGRLVRLIFGGALTRESSEMLPITAARVTKTFFDEEEDVPLLVAGSLEMLAREESNGRTAMEFHSDWTPLKSFSFDSDTPDFQRRVTIAGSDDRRHWTELSGGIIRRLGPDRSLSVEIPESRWKFYRVEIVNGAAKPLVSPRVRTGKVQYELLLNAATAPEHITIYYGANEPPLPAEGAVTPPKPGDAVGTYRLSPPVLNPLRRFGVTDASNYRFFAGGLILCGALAALWYVVRALYRSRETLPRG